MQYISFSVNGYLKFIIYIFMVFVYQTAISIMPVALNYHLWLCWSSKYIQVLALVGVQKQQHTKWVGFGCSRAVWS